MDAIVSGSAGVALLLSDNDIRAVVYRDGKRVERPARESQIPYLLGDARDLTFLENTQADAAIAELEIARSGVAALHLMLMLCDPQTCAAAVAAAAHELETLAVRDDVAERAERILFASPMPREFSIPLATERCHAARSFMAARRFECLAKYQPSIASVRRAWDALSSELFGDERSRGLAHGALARHGFCRTLVRAHHDGDSLAFWLATARNHESLRGLVGSDGWLTEWTRQLASVQSRQSEHAAAAASPPRTQAASAALLAAHRVATSSRIPTLQSARRPSPSQDSGDILRIVEAAYNVSVSDEQWLADVASAALPMLDDGFGLSALEFRTGTGHFEVLQKYQGCLPEHLHDLHGSLLFDAALFQRASLVGPVVAASQLFDARDAADQVVIRAFDALGIRDSLWITAAQPSGLGCGFHVGRSRVEQPSPYQVRRWERVAAHIATAVRLRHRLKVAAESGSAPRVVLDPTGRLHHTSDAVVGEEREALRRAVLSVEASRSAMRFKNPDASLASWPTLTAGRWSLVDQVEGDGRRFIVAVENAPHVPGTSLLTNLERMVVQRAQRGLSDTAIARQLGFSVLAVTELLHRATTKLGVRTRAELLAIGNSDRQSRRSDATSPNQLSEREREVWDLLVKGHSLDSIASRLGVSQITANAVLQRVRSKVAATARVGIGKAGRGVPSIEALTERERQVVGYAKLGHHNKLIAYELGLSTSTVRVILSRVATKLGVRTRSEIIAAVRPGTEPPSPD